MKFLEILKENRKLGAELHSPKYEIGIISNITITPLKDILEHSLRKDGINAEVVLGDYDSIVQDSIKFSSLNAVIVIWEAINFIDGFHYSVDNLTTKEYEDFKQKTESEIGLVLSNLKKTPLVIINKFSSAASASPILHSGALDRISHELNSTLQEITHSNQIIIDIDKIISNIGLMNAIDHRQFRQTKSLYTFDFFELYANSIKPVFISAQGRSKKLLVLDCDNTLWGGVVGEDGIEGIKLASTDSDGSIFVEIQSLIKTMLSKGVILALCSKNNAHDVDNVIQNHPDMLIKDDDIVIKKVNWSDKAQNIKEIAAELNIGLDSFIFVDDSPFEIELVKSALPEVTCYKVPANLSEYPHLIKRISSHFYKLSQTNEDEKKTDMYKAENARKSNISSYDNLEDYLKGLELNLKVVKGNSIPIERAAQLTQKTNQFNLTTKRYTEAELRKMLEDSCKEIFCFHLSDRFGSYGYTGLAITHISNVNNESIAEIDSFLMSCRVIGRTVEKQFFFEIVRSLKRQNISKIIAYYYPSAKNIQVKNFYEDLGFDILSNKDGTKIYELNIINYAESKVPYIKIVG